MKNAFNIVILSSLMAGCASLSQQATARTDRETTAVAAAQGFAGPIKIHAAGIRPASSEALDPLPNVRLTEELLYQLLSAEIAFQRGEWQSAYITMLTAAQQTRDPRLAHRATEIALAAKQRGEALSAAHLWRELAPHSEEAAQYFLGLVVLGDDIEVARPLFAQRLKETPPQARGLMMFQTQRMLSRAKDKTAAFSMLEDLMAPYLATQEAHLALAQGAFASGNSVRASAEARAALAIRPDSELAALMLAQATPDKGDVNKFLISFLDAHPAAREVRLAYARILIDQKQYRKARGEFETLLKGKPDDLTSLYALGILSTQAGDLTSAERYLTIYLDTLAKNPDEERDPTQALLMLAQIAEDRNDIDGALKWLAQIESGESYLGAQIKRAQLIAKRGDIAGAQALLTELKPDSEPEQAQIIVAESQLLRNANRPADALATLEAGIKRFPNNTDLLYDYAMAAEKDNRIDIMESTLRKIMKLAPNNQHAYNALGYSLAERNIRLPEALALIEKALKLAPDDPFIMDSLGWVQFRMGNIKEAEESLRRAYDLRPDPEIAVHLGEVLWIKGQKEDAQRLWRDASKKDPQNDTLKSTLARLHTSL